MISIIIPMYNSEKYIEKCIESILNNLYKNFEIIVVDDGSTDDSIKIVKNTRILNYYILTMQDLEVQEMLE